MKSFAAVTLLTLFASTVSSQASNGCDENYSGSFEIAPYNVTASIPSQAETVCTTNPIVTLKNGVLTDQDGRTGEVVANHQFQFDNPVQGPTTSGFSVCSNGSLALHGNALFYGCTSGDFSNLYDIKIGAQCHEIYIVTFPCSGSGATPAASTPEVASSTSSSSSSTSSSTTSTTSTSSTTSTPVAPPTTSTTSTPVAPPPTSTSSSSTSTYSVPIVPPPVLSTTVSTAPFPAGNSTTTSATATKAITTTTSSSTPPASTTTATFKGAASMVAAGGKMVAVVAGIAAFALF